MAALCLRNRFPMTATYNPRPAQSSPYPTTWIQDGGAVFAEPVPNDRYPQSAPLPVQSLSKHVDPRWRRCVYGTGFPSNCPAPAPILLPSCPSQSSPSPTTWIQDGGGAVFAEPVLCLAAQFPLQLCTHHAPPSPVPIQPRGSKMAALCLRNRFSV
jgi:hypothetical protein